MARFAIEKYVEQKNQWRKVFGEKPLSLMFDAQRIAEMLDGDLSPENLTCDGELPRSEVQRRYKFLSQAASELKSLYPNVRMYEFA